MLLTRLLTRNPLIIAPMLGFAFGTTGLPLPTSIERFLSILGGAAGPCALVCIGVFLAQESTAWQLTSVNFLVGMKLFAQPMITALIAFHLFSLPAVWSYSAVLLSALPMGTGPFTLVQAYGLQTGTTSRAMFMSHVCSIVTVSLLVAYLV